MARNLWRAAVVVWLCWGLALLLSGCGGNADDCPEDDTRCATTQPVDCKTRPELCQ